MRNGKSGTGYMELNTINKTGTWSETADRINSNFSKISIEVEEIKQNGGGGSGGDGGFKFYIIPFNGRTVEVYSGDISNFEQISVL